MSDRSGAVLLWLALVSVGALAWGLQMQPSLLPEARGLAGTPHEIGGWFGQDDPADAEVDQALDADFQLQRTYRRATGEIVWLYVGYYGTARGGRPAHTPRGCYTGAGWGITDAQVLDADPRSGLRVQEYRVEREGQTRLVHFWYRSHRRTGMVGGLDQNIDRMLGRLMDGRADGALIRVSTPITEGDEVAARGRLLAFGAALDPILAERWPTEQKMGSAGMALDPLKTRVPLGAILASGSELAPRRD
ncbi:MAG: EpsI family protein [bacterium TMED88]|nr:EpsI family protein [Deltaproteobacteria bacterium]OUV25192.1 MAG: EpsI family protein [bacterium TMED88]